MSRLRSIIGAIVLCALGLCIADAASASAQGLTAVECREAVEGPGTGKYTTPHCETPLVEAGDFETLPISESTNLETAAVGESRLTLQFPVNKLVVTCTAMHTTGGKIENVTEGEEMHVHGEGIVLHYTGCAGTVEANTAKRCAMPDLVTPPMTSITGPEHLVTFKSEGGNIFEFITPKACVGSELPVSISGSLVGVASTELHSHITFTPESSSGSLKANGSAGASFDGTQVAAMYGLNGNALTAASCKQVAPEPGHYKTSHCETPESESGEFDTVPLPPGESTKVEGHAEGEVTFSAIIGGGKLDITCEELQTSIGLENVEVAGEPTTLGSGGSFHYTKCHAAPPANHTKKCEIESITGEPGVKGTIMTNALEWMTGAEHEVTIEAEGGGGIAKFKILKGECGVKATTEVELTGSVIGIASTEKHSHITFTPSTNGTGLKANGATTTYTCTQVDYMKGTEETVGLQSTVKTIGLETF